MHEPLEWLVLAYRCGAGTCRAEIDGGPIRGRHLEEIVAGFHRHVGLVAAAADVGQLVAGAPAVELAAQIDLRIAEGHGRLEASGYESGKPHALGGALGLDENRGAKRRHREGAAIVGRARAGEGGRAHRLVRRFAQCRMQRETFGRANPNRAFLVGPVEHRYDGVHAWIEVGARRVIGVGDDAGTIVDAHRDQVALRPAPDVVEAHAVDDVLGARQAEERTALGDGQKFLERRPGQRDVFRRGHSVGVREGGSRGVVRRPLRRQAHVPVVRLAGEVHGVEPIPGVVAVRAQRFGAQKIRTHVDEGHALAEQHQGLRLGCHSHPIGGAGFGAVRQHAALVDLIPEREAIVNGGVVDALLGIRGVAAVAGGAHGHAGIEQQLIIRQVASEAGANARQVSARGDGKIPQPVAHSIIEGADAGASGVGLGGHFEAFRRTAGRRRPALAVEVGVGVHGLHRGQRLHHQRLGMQAHPIEAESVHLVVAGPEHRRILDELAHHGVFCRGVAATGSAFDAAGGGVAAVVVAGNDAVEYREGTVRAFVRCVVVHHVHHHPQPHRP